MSKEMTYSVNRQLIHDGEEHEAGGEVVMTSEQAESLLSLGVISLKDSGEMDVLKVDGKPGDSKVVEKPEGDELTTAIKEAIGKLKQPDDFTKAGRPKIAALEPLLGYDIKTAELDPAWDQYQEENK